MSPRLVLTLSSRLKEELIRELGKTSRSAKSQSHTYLKKIQALEQVSGSAPPLALFWFQMSWFQFSQESAVVKEELARVRTLLQKHEESSTHNQDSEQIVA